MSIQQINPYINLNGTGEKAIELYQSALGAVTENIMRYSDVKEMTTPVEHKNLVMHATLRIGAAVVMLSDVPSDQPAPAGGKVQIAIHFDDLADQEKKFNALAAGGTVTMPLQDTFWAARFGMLTDAYGVQWMFNCALKQGETK
jgi:PhnB protein